MVRPARVRNAVLLTIAAAVVVLAGCGTGEPPSPFPERPEDIDVSRLDPCALLPPARQAELGVKPGVPSETRNGPFPVMNCRWDNDGNGLSYYVHLADEDAGRTVSQGSVEQVAGYGAVRLIFDPESTPRCALAVDVEPGRFLMTQVQSISPRDDVPQSVSEVCREVTPFTVDVIETARSIDG